MRVIKPGTVREWMRQHPAARPGLEWWLDAVQRGSWGNLIELRRTFPAADSVKVASGRQVIVFNISGNSFRLIAAVHFNTGLAYALAFMTHAEYSKERWKATL
jgi:mRNA interferase HigB